MVDGVELDDLGIIQTDLERVFEDFENKRITMQIQDESIVIRR